MRSALRLGSVTLFPRRNPMVIQLRSALRLGSVTLRPPTAIQPHSCGLLSGSDRLHCPGRTHERRHVAVCSQARIGYTNNRCGVMSATVAVCSQARIGYTGDAAGCGEPSVAVCSQARIGYTSRTSATRAGVVAVCSQARIGYTRTHSDLSNRQGCGLLSGSDRLH